MVNNLSNNLTQILQQFQPISLAEMDGVQLMNRTDTKFMFDENQLAHILPDLMKMYKTLEVQGIRQSRYETLYFDTAQFYHYTQHHNGKKLRFKIRKRSYVESELSFLEVKKKNNKGRTFKSRIKVLEITPSIDERGELFISEKTSNQSELEPKIWNSYNRTTLVDTVAGERVTLDTDLVFYFENKKIELKGFVIAEVKQDGENRHSRFMQHMKKRLLRPEGISKYCLGVALLYPQLKTNTFKEKILRINKIRNNYAS